MKKLDQERRPNMTPNVALVHLLRKDASAAMLSNYEVTVRAAPHKTRFWWSPSEAFSEGSLHLKHGSFLPFVVKSRRWLCVC